MSPRKHAHRLLSPWVHSRSLRSPGRMAHLLCKPRALGRLRAMDYGDNLATAPCMRSSEAPTRHKH
jgi:hypothetical protein